MTLHTNSKENRNQLWIVQAKINPVCRILKQTWQLSQRKEPQAQAEHVFCLYPYPKVFPSDSYDLCKKTAALCRAYLRENQQPTLMINLYFCSGIREILMGAVAKDSVEVLISEEFTLENS